MKLLLIAPSPNSHASGGIRNWTQILFKEGLPKPITLDLVNTGVPKARSDVYTKKRTLRHEAWRSVKIMGSFLRKTLFNRPDIIHLNCCLSRVGIFRDQLMVIFANLLRIKIIVHFRGDITTFAHHAFRGLSGRALNYCARHADLLLPLNLESTEYLRQITQPEKIHQIANYINPDILAYTPKTPPNTTPITVGFIGGITRSKGALEILGIAKAMPDVQFHLIGPLIDDAEPAYQHAPKNIVRLGTLSDKPLFDEISRCNIFLFPSHSEGFPNAVLEAMGFGLPIVATHVGAIPEMIDTAGGYTAPVGDIQAMIAHLQTLIDNPETRLEMGAYNRQKVASQYTYHHVIGQLIHCYQALSPQHQTAPLTMLEQDS